MGKKPAPSLKCPSCGKTLGPGVKFCLACGCQAEDQAEKLAGANLAADSRMERAREEGAMMRIFGRIRWLFRI